MSDSQLEYLINTYSDNILRLSFSYLKNIHDAQDVSQDIFVKLFSLDKDFIDTEHEKAFILHITSNVCKNILKSSWKKRVVDFEDIGESETVELEDESLWHMVSLLPNKYCTVIYLHYHEGYKIAEISEILEVKQSAVKARLVRGRERLKKLLGGDFYES